MDTTWYAPGVGQVKESYVITIGNRTMTTTSQLTDYFQGGRWPQQWGPVAYTGGWSGLRSEASGVAVDQFGNIYVIGITSNVGAFLTKYDPSGSRLWVFPLNVSMDQNPTIAVGRDNNIYIESGTSLTKCDPSGQVLWTKALTGQMPSHGVTTDHTNNVYAAGGTWSDLDGNINAGSKDAFLIKYDASGNKLWSRLLGATNRDESFGVTVDRYNSIYMVGNTGGGTIDGNQNAFYQPAGFLVKYDAAGNKQWTRLVGASLFPLNGGTSASGVAVDSADNVYVTGSTCIDLDGNTNSGYSDAYITKYDPAGNWQWTRLLGGAGTQEASGIGIDRNDKIYVVGNTYDSDLDGNFNQNGYDVFLAKYDSDGNRQWTRLVGTPQDDQSRGIALDQSDNIYITGFTSGDLGGNFKSTEYSDFFLMKYDSNGIMP